MTTVELLEWGYYTLKDQLKFGLPEEIAITRREVRVRGVLKDAIEQVKELNSKIESLESKIEELTTALKEYEDYDGHGVPNKAGAVLNFIKD